MSFPKFDSNMIPMKFQSEKYAGSSINKHTSFACVWELQFVTCSHQSFPHESVVARETEVLGQKERPYKNL